MATITIDGKDYDADTLSADARTQLINLQVTDQKIADLQTQIAIYQTARAAYARKLLALLPREGILADPDPANLVH
ncbi:DUF6447 family protein [Candidatus Accumulibacter contiguus]|jgi:hypothetical protein|uniref:Uncharacterized protein n=1 Tax=Candidatus Accumulibacter contiguus TaxID=2954381 RepID=A0ABX1TE69_9PROT|nr:DUF6447 family protein [Candidatus Accumulibacter contiguus]NMQ07231.1 hypothetical protein [Candidatus Accumulibacter contiguus]